MRTALLTFALLAFACSSSSAPEDTLTQDAEQSDSPVPDVTVLDVPSTDTPDTSAPDVPAEDTKLPDLAPTDATIDPDVVTVVWPEPVTLQVVDGVPLIPGSYDDSETWPFVIDTLSQICFVDDDLVGDFLYHEVDATFGNDLLIDLLVKGREMEPDEMYLGTDIGGLIGQSYFQQRFVVIDYPRERFYSFPEAFDLAAVPMPDDLILQVTKVAVAQQNAFPVVSVALGELVEDVPLLADTSSRISVITQKVFDQLDDGTMPRVEGYRFTSKYGEDAAFLTRLPPVKVGSMWVMELEAVVIPDDHHLVAVLEPNGVHVEGYLGAQFWNRFAVAIDAFGGDEFTSQVFTLLGDGVPPEAWAGRWHKVGIELSRVDGATLVDMVYVGSDAEALGLEVGDQVMKVDGVDVDELTLEETRTALQGTVGETVELVVSKPLSDEPWAEAVQIEEILP